ncbi:MAG: AAA family ATPase [Nitrospina sp.]|jgi:general secretion pathway protein A|nr:AAA family ATPase [Nitrospina sp.]MBT5631349.1 AAA family ATPase [Nitrospina sp.]
MYENFYRFKEKPFSLTPDPKFLYLNKQYQGALDHMLYGIKQKEGFMVIAGDVGTGKTTLCRCLLDRLDENVEVALILNPMLSDMDLLRNIVQDLSIKSLHARQPVGVVEDSATGEEISIELEADAFSSDDLKKVTTSWINGASKKELIDALNVFLLDQHDQGKSTVLIIDEAQNLSLAVMEQLRILSNLETEKDKLLQIIFVGQLELNEKLKLPTLKQLNQRISIRYKIAPLSQEETDNYISHRILVAGASSQVGFAKSALKEIYKYSNGYPRLINLACDRSLLAGYNNHADVVDRQHVREAIQSLLGEDNKSGFIKQFLQKQWPLLASLIFFIAGLTLFILAKTNPENINLSLSPEKIVQKVKPSARPQATSGISKKSVSPEPSVPKSDQSKIVPAPVIEKSVEATITPPQEKTRAVQSSVSTTSAPTKIQKPSNAENTVPLGKQEGNYRIQVYSLKTQAEADEHVANLITAGFDTFWKKAVSAGQDWYIVYVGPFKDLNSAKVNLKALRFSGRKPILLSVSTAS